MAKRKKPLEVSEEEGLLIKELSRTKAVKEMARIIKAKLGKKDLSEFIANYLFFSAKGHDEEAVNHFIKEHFAPLLKTGIAGFFDLLPELVTDPHFFRIMISLYGKRFSLKKLFK